MSGAMIRSLRSLRQLLDSRQVSVRELAEQSLARCEAQTLGAVVSLDRAASLRQADAAQETINRGQAGPLTGIPLLHKDVFVTRDWPTTAGSRMLLGYRSPFDAEAVARLQTAGMVCVGKANCDEFAMGSANQHSVHGAARNPWAPEHVPGGSSGGSAAAVAAGLVPAATGTDTGGSVRQPAALCGITGFKPTYGRISRYGMVAYASSLDQAGPMAESAEDCALLYAAMAGHDPKDATSLELPAPDSAESLLAWRPAGSSESAPLKGLRIGLPEEYFGAGLAPDVRQVVESAIQRLRDLGAETVPVSLPRTELSIPAYYVIAPAEASSNLSRYDGVRYGHRAENPRDLADLYARSRTEGFGEEVRRRILIGTFVLSHGYFDAYYLQAQRVRRLVAEDFAQAFTHCDLLAGPVAPTVARRIDAGASQDPLAEYLSDIFTLGVSLAGLPAISVPAGFSTAAGPSLPVGLQLIGPRFEEGRVLSVAQVFQQATGFHRQQPGLDGGAA